MKKIITAIALALMMTACQEPYEKAIDEYYQEHLNDPSSYELIEMSSTPQVLSPSSMVTLEYADSPDLLDRLDKMRVHYKEIGKDPNEVLGYYIIHKYRAANRFGAKVKQKDIIIFNKDKETILHVQKYDK